MNKHILPGKFDPSLKDVHIIGAGISGLLLGFHLKKVGFNVTLFEKQNYPGGKIQSLDHSEGLQETAANALYLNPELIDLLKELNLNYIESTPKLKRLIWRGKPQSAFTFSFLFKLILNLFRQHPVVTDQMSVAEFFKPLMGQYHLDLLLSPALGGIYAKPAEELHFKSIFKFPITSKNYFGFIKLLLKNRHQGAKSVSFENGMSELIKKLSQDLDIKFNTPPKINSNVNTIICTSAHEASEIITPFQPEWSDWLKKITYIPLRTSTFFLKEEIPWLKKCFGILFPFNNSFNINGILVNHEIFKRKRNQLFSYTFISRGDQSFSPHLLFTQTNLNINEQKVYEKNWDKAIPQYDVHRFQIMNNLLASTIDFPICLFGNYIHGISIREINSIAKNFAQTNVFIQAERK